MGLPRHLRALPLLLLAAAGCGSNTVRRASPQEPGFPAGVAQLRWRTPLNERARFDPHPEECASAALVGDRLVLGSRAGNIVGVDVADGRVLWSTPVSGGVDGQARWDEARNLVYVGTDDGFLHAVEPGAGKIRWSYRTRGSVDRPATVLGDAVFASSSADRVFALEAASGRLRWNYEREPPDGFTIQGHSGPSLREGVLYTGFSDGYLVALQAATGEPLWAKSLASASEQFVDVDATPVFWKDLVVASSYSGGLYALRALDGGERWQLPIEGASAVRVAGDRLYVAAPRDGLAALDLDGQVLWRQGLAEAGALTPPVAVGPLLVFSGSRAGLFIVDRGSGRLLQLFNPGRGVCAAPAISADGRDLYVLANSGTLYALRLRY